MYITVRPLSLVTTTSTAPQSKSQPHTHKHKPHTSLPCMVNMQYSYWAKRTVKTLSVTQVGVHKQPKCVHWSTNSLGCGCVCTCEWECVSKLYGMKELLLWYKFDSELQETQVYIHVYILSLVANTYIVLLKSKNQNASTCRKQI